MLPDAMNDHASEQSTLTSRRSIVFKWWFYPLVLMLYALSIGPVAKLSAGKLGMAFSCLYAPLGILGEHSKWVNDAMCWYLNDVWKLD